MKVGVKLIQITDEKKLERPDAIYWIQQDDKSFRPYELIVICKVDE